MVAAPWPYINLYSAPNPIETPLTRYNPDGEAGAYVLSWACFADCIFKGLKQLGYTIDRTGLFSALETMSLYGIMQRAAEENYNGTFMMLGPGASLDLSSVASIEAAITPGFIAEGVDALVLCTSTGYPSDSEIYTFRDTSTFNDGYLEYYRTNPIDHNYSATTGYISGDDFSTISYGNAGFDDDPLNVPLPTVCDLGINPATFAVLSDYPSRAHDVSFFKSEDALADWLFGSTPVITYPRAEFMTPADATAQGVPLVIQWTAPQFGLFLNLQNFCFYVNQFGSK